MKINEHTAILTDRILLVPYSAHHVPQYHEWMQDEGLQAATASDPLTLPEEYAMQKSWRNDADKLTFIACVAPSALARSAATPRDLLPREHDANDAMIGDVNLFLSPWQSDSATDSANGDETGGDDALEACCVGEIEIMIAAPWARGKGLGTAVLLTFLWYIFTRFAAILEEYSAANVPTGSGKNVRMRYLRVKIGEENRRSLRLFERVGFRRTGQGSNYFGELELRFDILRIGEQGEVAKKLGITEPVMLNYRASSPDQVDVESVAVPAG